MEGGRKVDPAGLASGARDSLSTVQRTAGFLIIVVMLSCYAATQDVASAKRLFEQERWTELVHLLQFVPHRSAELDYEYGVALAHLERWEDANKALFAGRQLAPGDKRFLIELAGVAFKQKHNTRAIEYLRSAHQLDPDDTYTNQFLATLYFLQGNIDAALKYWNSEGKPAIGDVFSDPTPSVRPALLDHALAFSPSSILKLEEFRVSEARLKNLEIFPAFRFDLIARDDTRFNAVFRGVERNGFGSGRLEALLGILRGLPFQEIDPEYYNLNRSAINVRSLVRWDAEKRRLWTTLSGPLGQSPEWRYRVSTDLRNENWDVHNELGNAAPVVASLNLRREVVAAEIARLVGWRWRWTLGAEISNRDFRSVAPGTILTPQLLANGYQLKQIAALDYDLLRSPERRLAVAAGASSQVARLWSVPAQSFEKLEASLEAHWYPQSRGEDYQTRFALRGCKSFGQLPFDELFMLGLERDNDLLMRAHIGVRDGRKGSAPLGSDFFVFNSETDKELYNNGLIGLKLGPFLDIGKITGPVTALGSQYLLFDAGAQIKLRVLGVQAVFIYGRNLRTGNNAFYTTVSR